MFILYLLRYSSNWLTLSLLLWTIQVLIHCKMLVLDEFIIILACVQSQLTTPHKILKLACVGPVNSWPQQTLLPPSVSEWVPITTKLSKPDAQLKSNQAGGILSYWGEGQPYSIKTFSWWDEDPHVRMSNLLYSNQMMINLFKDFLWKSFIQRFLWV